MTKHDHDEIDERLLGVDAPGVACPICGGPANELGGLGNLTHYRCRDCCTAFIRNVSRVEG